MKRFLTVSIIMATAVAGSAAQDTQSFTELDLAGGLFSAYTTFQDTEGYLWVGTDRGVIRYDGNRSISYRYEEDDSTSLCQNHVNVLLHDPDSERFIAGTDIGASVYDFRTDRFGKIHSCGYRHVKSALLHKGDFWIGTTEGLLRLDNDLGLKSVYGISPEGYGLPSSHIACGKEIDGRLYFGTYDHFYRISPDGRPEVFPLPCSDIYHNNLVLDITEDISDKDKLWLGTERGLIHYSLKDVSYTILLRNNPVKAFMHSAEGDLWIGTDNGLFIRHKDGRTEHFRHDTKDHLSLTNNVVWSIFQDRAGDIFIGTDHGVSVAGNTGKYIWRKIESITGESYGLDIRTITPGKNGDLWLGGFDGLVRERSDGKVTWYKSEAVKPEHRISHNKIRSLYDDGDMMWVVSDGGLDMIDCISGNVRHFTLRYDDGRYVSDWMYSITGDDRGRLWIGSYEGLLCIEDRKRLLSEKPAYTVDLHISTSTSPSLYGNSVMALATTGRHIALMVNGRLDLYDPEERTITHMYCPQEKCIYSIASCDDVLYLATEGGAYMMTPENGFSHIDGNDGPIDIIVADRERIWTAGDDGIQSCDMVSRRWSRLQSDGKAILCGTDNGKGSLLFGSVNGYCIFGKDTPEAAVSPEKVAITGLYINGSRVKVGKSYGGNIILGESLWKTEAITLDHDQNSFSLEFSSFVFPGKNESYSYRLKGFEDRWQTSKDAGAVFLNIPAGKYTFEVRPSGTEETTAAASMKIRIRPVWYLTPTAYILYVLFFMGLCAIAFYYIRMKHQLQMEHLEREKALKSADMKTEFLANVTHEFKSPLSIITGFTGRMLTSESDSMRKKELRTVQHNAEKIQLLLEQMLKYNENDSTDLFMPVATSLQELAKDVYDRYEEAFRNKEISVRFVAEDIQYIFMTDRMKMESVLQNLLSNALKFTPRGGSVLMSVSIGDETPDMVYADIKVEDTGCGIRKEELEHVFERRYLAPSGQDANMNGSGIGLDLVKEIVGMHKGKVWVSSEEGKGTCFTVRLSTMKADSFILKDADKDDYTLHSLSKVWQHDRKPIILLVEDNPDIRDFITASLGKDYTFVVAEEGQKGLDLIAGEKIDLVVTDIAMPSGMDGLTMSRHIRNSLETAFLPIIVLTGKDDMKTRIMSFEYADAFISKPFSLGYLNSRIIQLLIKHEQYLDKMKRQRMLETKVEEVHSPDEKFLQEMVDIVSRHLDDPSFSASMLCEEGRYSQKQTYRKIKQLTGMNIVEFIRDARLRKAAMYLGQGKLTVNEVMYKVGFTTASYFAKCFKDKYGISPSEYHGK